jgi:quercetin dioxygenase-like cupin family protein
MPVINTAGLPTKEIVPGFEARFIHTPHVTIGYINITAGSILPEHGHPHEQVTHVLEGKLELTINGVVSVIEPGMVAVIPGNVRHSGRALTDCRALDVFHPVREDYKAMMQTD